MRRTVATVLRSSCLVLLGGLIPGGCVYPTPPLPWDLWEETLPDHREIPVEEKMERLEEHLFSRHVSPEGLLIYRRQDAPFDPDDPASYGNLADVAIWTGTLLGGVAFQYAETHDPVVRERLAKVVGGVSLLQAVTGKPGLLARSVAPTREPFEGEQERHRARQGAPPLERYRFRGDVSKDQYFGILFGYAVLFTAISPEAPGIAEIRSRAALDVARIADHIWENDLNIVGLDGEVTTFGELSGYMFGFPIGPNASLCLLSQKLAHRATGNPEYERRYRQLVELEYPEATWLNKFQIFGRTNHSNDVMATLALYSLFFLETDDRLRDIYRESHHRLWKIVIHESNLLFHGVRLAMGELEVPAEVERDVRESLKLFPVDFRMLEVDLTDHPAVDRGLFNERKGKARNRTAIPLHLRKTTSFTWKSSPFAITGNVGETGTRSVSGVDFYLVYWLYRHHDLLPSPIAAE